MASVTLIWPAAAGTSARLSGLAAESSAAYTASVTVSVPKIAGEDWAAATACPEGTIAAPIIEITSNKARPSLKNLAGNIVFIVNLFPSIIWCCP
ncbi:hypothetical protein D3C81_1602400 [compost metagenome]